MTTIETYLGIEPFTVVVDDSPLLQTLIAEAREQRDLPFDEKMASITKLTLGAMTNAYEQMVRYGERARSLENVTTFDHEGKRSCSEYLSAREHQRKYQDIVFQKHPLSFALEHHAGCCRYQGALFFILGYESRLGDHHFLHAAPVNRRANTVFNEVVQDGERFIVSIFTESLQDKSLDYSRQNPTLFEEAFEQLPGRTFFSYHRTPEGMVMVESEKNMAKR